MIEIFSQLVPLVLTVGITFGVGASTFALTFYIMAISDGVIDASEKRFMHAVYIVLRIGMVFIALGLLGSFFVNKLLSPIYIMQLTLLGILTVNAILMTLHKMPMTIGPVLAGGSWYGLFLVTNGSFLAPHSYTNLLIFYGFFLIFFFVVFHTIKKIFVSKTK